MDKQLKLGHQRSNVPHVDTPRPMIRPTSRINIKWHPENRLKKWGPRLHNRCVARSASGLSVEEEQNPNTMVTNNNGPNKEDSVTTQLKEANLKAHDAEKGDLRDTDSDEESSSSKRSREEMEDGVIDEEDVKAHGSGKKSKLGSGRATLKQEGSYKHEKPVQPKRLNMQAPVQYRLESLHKSKVTKKLTVEEKSKGAEDTGRGDVGASSCESNSLQIMSKNKATCKGLISKNGKEKMKKPDEDSAEESDEDKENWTKVVQRLTDEVDEVEPVQSLSSQLQRTSPPLMNQEYEQVQSLSSQLQGTSLPTHQPVFTHPWGLFPFGPVGPSYPAGPRYQNWPQPQYLPYPFQVRQQFLAGMLPGTESPSTSQSGLPTQYFTPPYSRLEKTPVSSTGASGEGSIDTTPGYCRYTPPGDKRFATPSEGSYQSASSRKASASHVPVHEHLRGHAPEGKHIFFQSSDDDDDKDDHDVDDDGEQQEEGSSTKRREADGIEIESEAKFGDGDFTPARPKRRVYVPGKLKQMSEGRCDLSRIQTTEGSRSPSFIGLMKKETSVSVYSHQQELQNSSSENSSKVKSDQEEEKGPKKQQFISPHQALNAGHGLHNDEPRSQPVARIQPRRRLTLQEEVMMESIPKELHGQFGLSSSSLPQSFLPSLRSDVIYPWSKEEYIDTHCHIDFLYQRLGCHGTFDKFGRVRNFPDNYGGCVAVFCTPESFHPANELWKNLLNEDKIWGAFGCHPHHVKNYDGVVETNIMTGMMHSKAVAFGEIGLDYSNRNASDHILQHMVFKRQLALALKLQKPLVIHSRAAESDTLDIMVSMVPKDYKIHRHCFTGPPEEARTFLKAFPNSFIGITNLVTFPSAVETHRTAREIPLNKILLETDAPYFLPRQCPRELRWSHPAMAVFVAEKIARLKGITTDEVLRAVRKNTHEMYGI